VAEVVLRPVEDGDLVAFFAWQRDPESVRLAAVDARTEEAFTTHWGRIRADPTVKLLTIVADGAVAGHVVSWQADDRRLVGYWLGRPFWGRGIASAALAQLVDLDRRRPLHAIVAGHNAASLRVLEKAGFRVVEERPAEDGPDGAPVVEIHLVLEDVDG
jgi:RimJ/RimL family protein N-acetyltransferase